MKKKRNLLPLALLGGLVVIGGNKNGGLVTPPPVTPPPVTPPPVTPPPVTPPPELAFVCQWGDGAFATRQELIDHLNNYHDGNPAPTGAKKLGLTTLDGLAGAGVNPPQVVQDIASGITITSVQNNPMIPGLPTTEFPAANLDLMRQDIQRIRDMSNEVASGQWAAQWQTDINWAKYAISYIDSGYYPPAISLDAWRQGSRP